MATDAAGNRSEASVTVHLVEPEPAAEPEPPTTTTVAETTTSEPPVDEVAPFEAHFTWGAGEPPYDEYYGTGEPGLGGGGVVSLRLGRHDGGGRRHLVREGDLPGGSSGRGLVIEDSLGRRAEFGFVYLPGPYLTANMCSI